MYSSFFYMFGWWMIFWGAVCFHGLSLRNLTYKTVSSHTSFLVTFVIFFSCFCILPWIMTPCLCVFSVLEDIDHIIRMQWNGSACWNWLLCWCFWKRLVSLRNAQINSLKITNYLVSSYVLIAICHCVTVCVCVWLCVRMWVYVWLVHLAESTEAEFSVITKQRNQCRSPLDLLFSVHWISLMQYVGTEAGNTGEWVR